jgi:hypothetical protein
MNKNVFLSLLSLDSYNRVYGRRLLLNKREGGALKIGDAQLTADRLTPSQLQDWQSVGFYASDYVISANPLVSGLTRNGDTLPLLSQKGGFATFLDMLSTPLR